MTNREEFQYRLQKSMKNNLSLRLLEKCKEFATTGKTLKSRDFNKIIDELSIDPITILELAGISLTPWHTEFRWKDEYNKLRFEGGTVYMNSLDYLNFDMLADSVIYSDWCGFSQYIKTHESNLKTVEDGVLHP